MPIISIIVAFLIICLQFYIYYSNEIYEKKKACQEKINMYKKRLIDECKSHQDTLNYVAKLQERIIKVIRTNEFQMLEPYEIFEVPSFHTFQSFYLIIDKNRNVKLSIGLNPIEHYKDNKKLIDYYLKLSYDANDLHDLINECSINALYKQLKDKQTDKINDIIKKSFYDNK